MIDFESEPFLRAAEILMKADEAERALELLNNLPGYYRDNEPPEVTSLRRAIEASIFQVSDYAADEGEMPKADPLPQYWIDGTCRGTVISEAVKHANEFLIVPHIVEMGPGDYMLPLGMKSLGRKFTYEPIGVHPKAYASAKERLSEELCANKGEVWFVACEIIEHLWNPGEIAQTAARYPAPEKIFLSTPRYTFNIGHTKWRTEGQPHLRTYTPSEFRFVAAQLFKGYSWKYYDDAVMVLVGEKQNES